MEDHGTCLVALAGDGDEKTTMLPISNLIEQTRHRLGSYPPSDVAATRSKLAAVMKVEEEQSPENFLAPKKSPWQTPAQLSPSRDSENLDLAS